VSDIVARRPIPESIRADVEAWTGCIAGAIEENEYKDLLRAAGFDRIDIEPTRVYSGEDTCGCGDDHAATEADGLFMSAFIRATKPRR
jgi:hypothetical protein